LIRSRPARVIALVAVLQYRSSGGLAGGVFSLGPTPARARINAQRSKLPPFLRFVKKGEGGRFEIRRLRSAESLLTDSNLRKLKAEGERFDGRPYDSFFGWGGDRIYCSELIYKMYLNALGIRIGEIRKLKDFDLTHPAVRSIMARRYGGNIPYEEPVIAPSDMHRDPKLFTIYSNFPGVP
jgi:hypothetical protein